MFIMGEPQRAQRAWPSAGSPCKNTHYQPSAPASSHLHRSSEESCRRTPQRPRRSPRCSSGTCRSCRSTPSSTRSAPSRLVAAPSPLRPRRRSRRRLRRLRRPRQAAGAAPTALQVQRRRAARQQAAAAAVEEARTWQRTVRRWSGCCSRRQRSGQRARTTCAQVRAWPKMPLRRWMNPWRLARSGAAKQQVHILAHRPYIPLCPRSIHSQGSALQGPTRRGRRGRSHRAAGSP